VVIHRKIWKIVENMRGMRDVGRGKMKNAVRLFSKRILPHFYCLLLGLPRRARGMTTQYPVKSNSGAKVKERNPLTGGKLRVI
jgi:hypothetical protein